MRQRRAYVVGAYLLSGGPFMAYQMGRILQVDFGFEAIAVTVRGETPYHGIFQYDPIFPTTDVAGMEASIADDDVLIANPSFSRLSFGLRCRGLKVMYVQGFTTFGLLDCSFDLYVSVSHVGTAIPCHHLGHRDRNRAPIHLDRDRPAAVAMA